MRWRHIAELLFVMIISSCKCSSSHQMILDIGFGGRAISLSVDPDDDNHIFAIAPTGGLYQSVDGGAKWVKTENFTESGCFDVKVCPNNSQIVIATCIEDSKATNEGGIWRSTDGGKTWGRPPTSIVYSRRTSAFGISFMPGSSYVFVGTDMGVAYSPDFGASWSFSYPFGSQETPIYTVVSSATGQVVVAGPAGVRSVLDIKLSTTGDFQWFPSSNVFNSADIVPNALAVYTRGNINLFFYAILGKGLFYSFGGNIWNEVPGDDLSGQPAAYPGGGFRQVYVKVVPSASGEQDEMDLYFSDHSITCKKTIKWKIRGGGPIDFSAPWEPLVFNHPDPTDLVFSRDNKPIYASDDGGVEKSTDGGNTWVMSATAANGYNALQIYDIKAVLSPVAKEKNHLYFGTQDNNLLASPDNGQAWPAAQITEGGNIECRPVNPGDLGYITNLMLSNRPAFYHYQPIFTNGEFTRFPFPCGSLLRASINYVRDNIFAALGVDTFGIGHLFVSDDGCASFNPNPPFLSVNTPIGQPLFISGEADNLSIITPMDPSSIFQIDNVFNKLTGDEKINPIALPLGCYLGVYGAQAYSDQLSFGADPADTNFIILNDVANGTIWMPENIRYLYPHTGRPDWVKRPDVVNLVTSGGKYLFSLPDASQRNNFELNKSQVTCIRFDPLNHRHIAIGTMEAGIIVSKDRGVTWAKIKDSDRIRNVTDFAFVQGNTVYVTTWGSGIWVVSLDNTE